MIGEIPILPSLLEVITLTTGMGFAAVARVTKDRWVACSVRDEIAFGLKPGGELKVETTICNEIRDSQKAVIIDEVSQDPCYHDHHTPRMYGIQSYISVPIILKDGSFFGTLCAIDPRPAQLNNPRIIGMFNLFVDLISFHIAALREREQNQERLKDYTIQLRNYEDEVRQYQYISNHNLQEPLRKIRLFSDMLSTEFTLNDPERVKTTGAKINGFATDLSVMIHRLTDFSGLNLSEKSFETTDLNEILVSVTDRLSLPINEKNASISCAVLHSIKAVPGQMARLFYHLLSNGLKYAKPGTSPMIRVHSKDLPPDQVSDYHFIQPARSYCELCFEDDGIGIDPTQLEKIFDIFTRASSEGHKESAGIGLAQCRRIVRNHGGAIKAHSEPGRGATFTVVLPIDT